MPRLAIDTSFSRYSPGILLILEATKLWMNEGIVDFDMCRGDERYKKEMGGINALKSGYKILCIKDIPLVLLYNNILKT